MKKELPAIGGDLREDPVMGIQIHRFFDNGYGVSVVRGPYTYGGPEGLFELAVLHKTPTDKSEQLCYLTPITKDVIGWLTKGAVEELVEKVKQLPKSDYCTHRERTYN